jgi:eukaryotic-like serine/threonine-protein kinase
MGTSPEHWEEIKKLFEGALEQDPDQRSEYIEKNASDSRVRDEVLRLVVEHGHAGDFLSKPAFANLRSDQKQDAAGIAIGDLLDGKFKIVRLVAEGGMGQVWLAEQTTPLQRQVVVKFIKAGIYDETSLQRFQAERQSLAIMDHPCIAKVFDAGATPTGQPYFVMEYVPGLAITTYCDNNKLSTSQRLELFVRICEGVQHAHQKAIIHRDLKPSNILVLEIDGIPTPRIIDFGIAKAISPFAHGPEYTQTGGFVGTPGYMSPEQADPRVPDVDTRTDVYSLGAILYILLAGSPPFDAKAWQKKPLDEMLRELREIDPPRPSTKVSEVREKRAEIAEARGTNIRQLITSLRGDLDWITMKALEKDRIRRYATPLELATDIRRYLSHEPVMARPASTRYRVEKYVRRHRVGVGAACGVFLLLAGFSVLQAAQLRRTTRERDRANRITAFMIGMFKVSNPSEARGRSISAREILDRAARDIDTGLPKDPETQAQMMDAMEAVYFNLGLYSAAESLSHRVIAVRQRLMGAEDQRTMTSISNLANLLEKEGKFSEAEKLCRQVLNSQQRLLGPQHPDTLNSMNILAVLLNDQGHITEAIDLSRQILDRRLKLLGAKHAATLATMGNLGSFLESQGKLKEAEQFDRDTLEGRRQLLGSEHPDTLDTMNNLASLLVRQNRFPEGEQLFREVYETRLRILGPEHPDTITAMNNLAVPLAYSGNFEGAEKLFRVSLEIERRVLGPDHPSTISAVENLALVLSSQGQFREAEELERSALETRKRVLGPNHPDTALSYYSFGTIEAHRGKRDLAFSFLGEAVHRGLSPLVILGMETDPDLKSLHGDPRFNALVADAKLRTAAKSN